MKSKGFTLIEILIVIGIMVILLGAVIVAINPGRQFAQARNATRWTHVNAILNAVYSNMADNNGNWTCAEGDLPSAATNMSSVVGDYDICDCLEPLYMAEMPVDPSEGSYTVCDRVGGSTYDSKYEISEDSTTLRVTVAATGELGESISLTR